jgi:hypothetical protein
MRMNSKWRWERYGFSFGVGDCVVLIVALTALVSCGINEALKSGIREGGQAAAREVMDRLPEITPDLRLAIGEAVERGVDRAMDRLKPQSNGWLSSIISSIGLVLVYIFGHRYAWVRAAIDILKGKPEVESSPLRVPTDGVDDPRKEITEGVSKD